MINENPNQKRVEKFNFIEGEQKSICIISRANIENVSSSQFCSFHAVLKLFTTSPQILSPVCCLQLSRFQMLQRKLPPPAYSIPGPSSTPYPLPPKDPPFPSHRTTIFVVSQHIQILPVELALSPSVSLVFGLVTNPCCFFELYKYAGNH